MSILNQIKIDLSLQKKHFIYFDFDLYYVLITIGGALLIIEQFYPIYRIREFWANEERIKRFVGKYSNCHYEILRALVRCFDDVDRIVTPLHMFQETYEERTQEKLNLIFNY